MLGNNDKEFRSNTYKRSSKWYFVLPVATICFHYILMNLLYFAIGKVFLDVLHFSNEQVAEFTSLGDILMYTILIVVFFTIYKLTLGKNDVEQSTPFNLKDAGFSIIAGLGVAGVICIWVAVLGLIPALQKNIEAVTKGGGDSGLIGTILVSAIGAPIIEEIVFRGIVFKSLKKVSPVWVAIIVSSVLFGAYHMNIVQAIYASCMGIAAAIIYEKKNNLIFPILVHITNNFLAAVQEFLPKAGVDAINAFSIIMIPGLVYVMYAILRKNRSIVAI